MMLGDVLWYDVAEVILDTLQRNMLQRVLQHTAAQRVPAHCSTRLLLNRFNQSFQWLLLNTSTYYSTLQRNVLQHTAT